MTGSQDTRPLHKGYRSVSAHKHTPPETRSVSDGPVLAPLNWMLLVLAACVCLHFAMQAQAHFWVFCALADRVGRGLIADIIRPRLLNHVLVKNGDRFVFS